MYRIYAETVKKQLQLGHQGENEARCVIFNLASYKEEYGEGTWEIVNQRKGDTAPYLVTNTYELDDKAVWTLTNVDTDVAGEGRCELRYKVDGVLMKTDVFATKILPSLGDTGEAPTPSEDLIEKISKIKDEAAAAATAAKASEDASAESEKAAANSAESANASQEAAATSETNAAGSAEAAAQSETNAAGSADTAALSEKNAATSETNAGKSATAAAASEKAAAASATDAASSAKTASDASATVSEYEALWLGAENWRQLRMHQNILDNVEETVIDVALTNSQTYPHNNSQKTVAFETYRNKTDYYVYPEVIASSGGSVGDVVISDKLVNGFKVAYTGSATSATVRCHVFGGM